MTDTDAALVDEDLTAVHAYQALRDAKEDLVKAEQRVLRLFEQNGLQSVRVEGRLVYLERKLWARPIKGEEEALVRALVAEGHEDLVDVKVGTQRLSAWVREQEREEVPVPDSVSVHMAVTTDFGVRMKKG